MTRTQWAALFPDVAATWHPSRNGALTATGAGRSWPDRVWWRCPAGHEWREQINTRLALPQWKNGNRAACRECGGGPAVLVDYTYPQCGHTRRITKANRDKQTARCWDCERKLRDKQWRHVAATARESAAQAAGLVGAIERDYLSPGTPAPLAWEFHRYAMKLMQGAIGAEEGGVKRGAVGNVKGQLRALARSLPPDIGQAAGASERRGVLVLLDQAHWAAGWLYHLTGRGIRAASPDAADATVAALRSYLEPVIEAAGAGQWETAYTTAVLTNRLKDAAWDTSRSRSKYVHADGPSVIAYRELRLPVLAKDGATRYGRLDVVLWQSQFPDIVVEIDSKPNPGSARKLEFARDAGALAVWVRHGTGPVTAPAGVAVIDLR
jgi:hypothetical protein